MKSESCASTAGRRGFTIIETLIAAGIFGFATLGLLLTVDASLDAGKNARIERAMRNEMENRLAVLSAGPKEPHRQRIGPDGNGVAYEELIEPVEIVNRERTVLAGFWKVGVVAKRGNETWEASHLVYERN